MRSTAWLSLLPFMDPDGLRELLSEPGAFECHGRGVRDANDQASWPTVASVAYDALRNPHVHGGALFDGITFEGSAYEGDPVPAIDFEVLHDTLGRAIWHARDLSRGTGLLYGRDRVFGADDDGD